MAASCMENLLLYNSANLGDEKAIQFLKSIKQDIVSFRESIVLRKDGKFLNIGSKVNCFWRKGNEVSKHFSLNNLNWVEWQLLLMILNFRMRYSNLIFLLIAVWYLRSRIECSFYLRYFFPRTSKKHIFRFLWIHFKWHY